LVVLLVATGDDVLVDPALDGLTGFDRTRAVYQWDSGGVPLSVAMLLERCNSPRRLLHIDDDDARISECETRSAPPDHLAGEGREEKKREGGMAMKGKGQSGGACPGS